MGGEEKVGAPSGARQAARARTHRRQLLDADSFHEIGALSGRGRATTSRRRSTEFTPANFVMGRGRIEGRAVVVGGDDFTVRGGAADASIFQKQVHAERMAHELRLPIVRLVDGSGGGGSVKSLETERRSFVPFNPGWELGGREPRDAFPVGLALSRIGRRPRRGACRHEPLLRDGEGHVAAVRGRTTGGGPARRRPSTRSRSAASPSTRRNGAVDDEVHRRRPKRSTAPGGSCRTCRRRCTPSHRVAPPSTTRSTGATTSLRVGHPPRAPQGLQGRASSSRLVVDRGSLVRVGRRWGRSAVTGFARLDGWPVAILANDPYHYAGGWTADASREGRRASSISPTRSTCRWCTSSTTPASSSAPSRSKPARSVTAPARSPRSTRPGAVVLGDRAQGLRRRRRGAPERVALVDAATPGRRGIGARCRSKAASKPRIARSWMPPTTEPRCAPRSRRASTRVRAPVQDRGGLPRRGDHRPARHPSPALRVRGPRCAVA